MEFEIINNPTFFAGVIFGMLFDLIPCIYEWYYCRKAKHICADCKAWSCQGKHCEYKRKQKAGD